MRIIFLCNEREYDLGLLLFRQNILFLLAIIVGIGLMFSLSACGSDSTDTDGMMEEATVSATQQMTTVAATAAPATSSPTHSPLGFSPQSASSQDRCAGLTTTGTAAPSLSFCRTRSSDAVRCRFFATKGPSVCAL